MSRLGLNEYGIRFMVSEIMALEFDMQLVDIRLKQLYGGDDFLDERMADVVNRIKKIKKEIFCDTPIPAMIEDECDELLVCSYNYERNEFVAKRNGDELVDFDPFVGCAIELLDGEYYDGKIAKSVVGHTFTVKKSCTNCDGTYSPSETDIVSTSWVKP